MLVYNLKDKLFLIISGKYTLLDSTVKYLEIR